MGRVPDRGASRRLLSPPVRAGLVLAGIGLVMWVGLSAWAGTGGEGGFHFRDAWDSRAYFVLGVPVMAMAVAFAAFQRPRRAWRWPLWLVTGHQIGVLVVGLGMQSGLSLAILTTVLAVLLAVFFALPALAGSMLARRMMERAY